MVVTGYHTGIVVNEHTDGDNINLACNFSGLEFVFANHASRFGRVCAQRCTHDITVTGKHGFLIEQLDIEISGPGQTDDKNAWQTTACNINDPANLGIADINYWVVEGNVGMSAEIHPQWRRLDPGAKDRIRSGRGYGRLEVQRRDSWPKDKKTRN